MAKSNQTSSTLRTVAIFGAAVLIGAAALVYLNGSAGPDTSELAALSQALPAQSRAALAGEDGAFERFTRSQQRLTTLRRTFGNAAGGRSGDWQALESGLQSLVSNRQALERAAGASASLSDSAAEGRVIADQLLDRSGATTIIAESGERLSAINRSSHQLLLQPGAAETVTVLAAHVAYLHHQRVFPWRQPLAQLIGYPLRFWIVFTDHPFAVQLHADILLSADPRAPIVDPGL